MGTAADVLVGATGKVYGGATGTTLPTTVAAGLNAGFHDLGYISDNGVAQTIGSDNQEIKAWGGTTVRKIQTTHTVEYKLVMIETNPFSLAAYYGADNFDDALNSVELKAGNPTRQSWVVDVVDGDNVIRVVIPDGEVTSREDVVFKTDEAIGYGITITAYPDAVDVKAYQYLLTPGVS